MRTTKYSFYSVNSIGALFGTVNILKYATDVNIIEQKIKSWASDNFLRKVCRKVFKGTLMQI